MKLSRFISVFVLFIFFNQFTFAQSTKGVKGESSQVFKVSFDQIMEYEKQYHPTPKKRRKKNKTFPEPIEIDEGGIVTTYNKDLKTTVMKEPVEPSPSPDKNFNALNKFGGGIPPDVNGSVGPDHLMITLNTQVRIQDKEGNNLKTVSLESFWSSLPDASGVFDPRILYDPVEEKWIVVTTSNSTPAKSKLFIAVSETSNPDGDWVMWWIDPDETNNSWMDYPTVGFNKNWLVVSGNMFDANDYYEGCAIFAIDKEDLMTGASDIDYSRFTSSSSFTTIYPATTYDTEQDTLFLLTSLETNSIETKGYLYRYIISGDIGNEIFKYVGKIMVTDGWKHQAPGDYMNFAPQKNTSKKICSNNSRIQSLVYRNGKLWAAHHIFIPKSDPDKSAIQWWEIEAATGDIIQYGIIADPGYHYTFPSIAVNVLEEVFIGYCSFSSNQFASASYSFRTADDPEGEMRGRIQYKDGLDKYDAFAEGRNRWGDYSATWVDPSNDLDFWTIQEYADKYNKWGTWWAMIKRKSAPVVKFSSDNTLIPVGGSIDFFDESVYEPTSWQWTFENGTPSTSDEQNPQNIVFNSEGTFNVTLEATNEIGATTITKEDYVTTNTTVLPAVQFVASDSIPCMGAEVTFTDLTLHNPTSWEWIITPETFEFINGTNANSQHPEVEFQIPDNYTVELNTANNNGGKTLTKSNYINAGGLTMPYTESFEKATMKSINWIVDNPDDDKISWKLEDVEGNTPGNKAVFMDFINSETFGNKDRLISPALNFNQYDFVKLEFQHAYAQRWDDYTDLLNVYVSVDCGTEWTKVFEVTEDNNGSFATHNQIKSDEFWPLVENDWCGSGYGSNCYSIDISEWAGSTNNVKIMFEAVFGAGNNLFIDNVTFVIDPDLVNPVSDRNKPVYIYPNPSKGQFNVVINDLLLDTELKVMNVAGQVIYSGMAEAGNGNNYILDLSNYPKGIYFIRVSNDDITHSEKIIIR